jgi:hypothetical protein
MFELVAQQETVTDDDDDYKFPVKAHNRRDKEWKIFLRDTLHAVPLFRLKDGRRVAKSHLVDHWTSIPDDVVELEDEVREVMDVKDEKASSRVVEGNELQWSHPEDGDKQQERQVCQRLNNSSTALVLSSGTSEAGS